MCGIAGFHLTATSQRPEQQTATLRAMCDTIVHRGPDDHGYYVQDGCGLGMRRLSIIDLSTGHQPIANEDETVWIVFNGEIYNFGALREELIAKGHRFRTRSDTETIVHLYEEEGVAGFHRLNGMFAFAIWDAPRRRLVAARDRFGKKPLYYADLPEGLFFGSELKCLRAAGVPLEVDTDSFPPYFLLGYIPEPRSAFRAIRKLAPGGWLIHDANGLKQGRYWTLPVPEEPARLTGKPVPAEEPAMARICELLDDSVRSRMIADVPLGAFLSGGIDSSTVVATMARFSGEPVKTFSIGFEEADFNELEHARALAAMYNTEHHEILVRPDTLELVNRIVHHLDEPLADSATIPTLEVSEFAAQHVKVVLTGDGGDELFGGYHSFFRVEAKRRFDRLPGFARSGLSLLASLLPYSTYGKNYLRMMSRQTPLERYFEDNYAPYFLRERLLAPEWLLPGEESSLRAVLNGHLLPPSADILTQAMYFEASSNLTAGMLTKVDRMSMAASLEVRCPLLDYRLAEYAASLPPELKVRDGKGKYILIRAIADRLPASLLNREKMGFGVPLSHWFRSSLRDYVRDTLTSQSARNRGITSPQLVLHLLEEHQSQRRDNSQWLWALLMLELWLRQQESRS